MAWFWWPFFSLGVLAVLAFWRVDVSLSLAGDVRREGGAFAGVLVGLFGGKVNLKCAAALVRRQGEWIVYYRLSRRGTLRSISLQGLLKKWQTIKKDKPREYDTLEGLKKSVHIHSLTAEIHLGIEDAARCALLSGALQQVLVMAIRVIADQGSCLVTPRFNQKMLRINLEGIVTLRMEQIIGNAVKKARMRKKEQWSKNKEREKLVVSTSD